MRETMHRTPNKPKISPGDSSSQGKDAPRRNLRKTKLSQRNPRGGLTACQGRSNRLPCLIQETHEMMQTTPNKSKISPGNSSGQGNEAPRRNSPKNKLSWRNPRGRLDRLPYAVRPPPPENRPRVNPQLPIDGSPDSPHGLKRNFGDSWVTSWTTSPPKDIHQNALNQRESRILSLYVMNSSNSENHQNRRPSHGFGGARSPRKEAQGPHV